MELQDILPLLSRWAHVIPAILLVGGTLFMRFVLIGPCLEHGASDNLRESIRKKWARLVMLSIFLLLVSGLYNAAIKAIGFQLSPLYLGLLTAKIVLGLIIFFLISVLTGRSDRAKKFREREELWLNIVCVLMVVLVAIAGFMKMSPQPVKVRDENASRISEPMLEAESQLSVFGEFPGTPRI